MFKIGDFSKLNKISVKTLRYYDEVNLLKPVKIDSENNYRYYSASQIPKLNRIITLKNFGFSLAEIKEMLDEKTSENDFINILKQKTLQIKEEINHQENKLNQLFLFINNFKKEKNMSTLNYNVMLKEVDALKVVYLKKEVSDFSKQSELWEKLISYLNSQKIKIEPPLIAIYHSDNEENLEMEVAAYIKSDITETKDIKVKILDNVKTMACITFKGGNDKLAEAYNYIQNWIEKNDCKIGGLIREVHWEGYWSTLDTSQHITEIQIPVTM